MGFLGTRRPSVPGTRISVDSAWARRRDDTRARRSRSGGAVGDARHPSSTSICARASREISLTATIEQLEQLGATSFLYCALPGGEKLTVQLAGQVDKRAGETIDVCFPPRDVHLFAKTEGEPALERLKPPPAHLAA
jgi:ABC-type sugar transport system ATPase subunit